MPELIHLYYISLLKYCCGQRMMSFSSDSINAGLINYLWTSNAYRSRRLITLIWSHTFHVISFIATVTIHYSFSREGMHRASPGSSLLKSTKKYSSFSKCFDSCTLYVCKLCSKFEFFWWISVTRVLPLSSRTTALTRACSPLTWYSI